MRRVRVRLYYGILVTAVTLWWVTSVTGSEPDPNRFQRISHRKSIKQRHTDQIGAPPGVQPTEANTRPNEQNTNDEQNSPNNNIVKNSGEPAGSFSGDSNSDGAIERNRPADSIKLNSVLKTELKSATSIPNSIQGKLQVANDDDSTSTLQRTSDLWSTDPVTEESKVLKEYHSVHQSTLPFVTSTTGRTGVTTTTSRSTRIEQVSVFSDKDEEEDSSEEDTDNEEVKDKKKKKKLVDNKEQHTTLRTGKILAGKQPFDALPISNSRKSGFQQQDYLESYPLTNHKPYYETSGNNGGRVKPYKPLYEFDSNYGGGNARRPVGFDTSRRPGQDFSIGSGGLNPFLHGAGGPVRRPSYTELTSTLRNPSSIATTFGDTLATSGNFGGFRKPSLSTLSEPFSTSRKPLPSYNSPLPSLEGGFKPILSSNYNELPSQQQGHRQKFGPNRGETSSHQQQQQGGPFQPLGSGLNFNNIGMNMLYKETNVLNQDFTSSGSGGVANTSVTTPSPPLTLAGDSNSLDVGVTNSMGAEFERKINRTRVANLKSEIGNYIRVPVTTPTVSSISEDAPSTLPSSKYKLRKPTLLGNGTKKTPFETNTILPDPSTRKPVVKNNIKNRLSTTRTKVHSTTTPVPATTMLPPVTMEDEESEELETSTQYSASDDPKPTTLKPIQSFAQKKRPHNKLNYLSSSGEAKDPITTLSPVKLSTNTRARKPTQAPPTEGSLTTPPPKKIKPFVNWASRLQKVSTNAGDENDMTTMGPDDDAQDKATLTPPSVGFEPVTPRLTSVQTTTSVGIGRDEITTAKLFENTIPSKANNDEKKQVSDESDNKEDSRFTVKDFISKFHDDSDGDNSEEILSKPSATHLKLDVVNRTSVMSENSIHAAASPATDRTTLTIGSSTTLSSQLTSSDSTTKGSTVEHVTIRSTTMPNVGDYPVYPVTTETWTGNGERKTISNDNERPDSHWIAGKTTNTTIDGGTLNSESPIVNTSIKEKLETSPVTDVKIFKDPMTEHPSNATKLDSSPLDNVDILEDITTTLEGAQKTQNFEETNIADLTRPEGESHPKEMTDESIKHDKEDANSDKIYKETDVYVGKKKHDDSVEIKEPNLTGDIKTSDSNEGSDSIKDINDRVSDSDSDILPKMFNTTDINLLQQLDTKQVKQNQTNQVSTLIETNSNEETQSVMKDNEDQVKKQEDTLKKHESSQDESHDEEFGFSLTKEISNRESWGTRPIIISSTTPKFVELTDSTTQKLTSPSVKHYSASSTTQTSSVLQKLTSPTSEHFTTSTPTNSSDPWRTNFSEYFSKFDVTTEEHWSRPSTKSKTTSAEISSDEGELSTLEPRTDNGSNVESSSNNSDTVSKSSVEYSNDELKSSEETSSISTLLSSVSVTPPTQPTSITKQTSGVTMGPRKQSSIEGVMRNPAATSTKIPQQSFEYPVTLEGDFYSVEDMSPPLTPPPPMIVDPKHYIQLTIHSTPAEICASIPAIVQAIIALFQYGSMRVQSADQMRVKNQDLLCTSPEMKESLLFVEFYLTDGMGAFDRDINEEFIRLYNKVGGLETDLMISDAHLIGEEPIRDEVYIPPDQERRPENSPRIIAAIMIASVAVLCLIVILVLLFIMRKKGRSFNNRQRCIPVSLDDYSLDNVSVYNSTRRKSRQRASKRSYGNPGFDDPTTPSHPLAFASLSSFSQDRRGIEEEFGSLPTVSVKPDELPVGVEDKNRYANVIPIPETRVRLCAPGEGASPADDYINANYVRGPKGEPKFYIACQAPLQNTIEDFWRMIWTHQAKVILMVTPLFENSVEKCADYLPPSEVLDCHRVFGDFQITLKKREVREKYVISSLQIKNLETNLWRELTHAWYTNWPITGVPNEENSLIAFLIEARAHTRSGAGNSAGNAGPIIVHCSPGTGRTGTVIACDILIRHFETSRNVDVPRVVSSVRQCRAGAVATGQQYAFIYRVLNVYATKLTGGALDSI
uniref:protein-tyrosine-phosphatase n=1 Tax=Cacopsylla melanoneura TaxID=428564 RepID=A0A8D8XQH1_9HEMI